MSPVPPDRGYYLGSPYQSMEHLPRWYQMIALLSVFSLAYFRNNALIEWTAVTLHSSLGTQSVWYPPYQLLLERMNFNERLCFTLYGVALSLVGVLLYHLSHRERLSLVGEANSVLPGHPWITLALFICMGVEGVVVLKEVIAGTISEKNSLAHLALNGFRGIRKTRFDPRLAISNQHFIIQIEILKAYVLAFLWNTMPSMLIGVVLRLARDVPFAANPTMRWYIITFTTVRAGLRLYWDLAKFGVAATSTWILVVNALLVWATVNFLYGPSRRFERIAATSRFHCILTTFVGFFKCWVMLFITHLAVLTIVVSVHVVELICMWLMSFLVLLWLPAMIDSCSTDYLVGFVAAGSFAANSTWGISAHATLRLAIISFMWTLNVCLLYNVVTNATLSRYGGIAAVVALVTWVLVKLDGSKSNAGLPVMVSNTVSILRNAAVDAPVNPTTAAKSSDDAPPSGPSAQLSFRDIALSGTLFLILMQLIGTIIAMYQSPEVAKQLKRNHIILVTPGLLFRKCVHSIVQISCFVVSILLGYVVALHIIPNLVSHLPDVVSIGIALIAMCTLLGSVMDAQEALYEGVMRLLGVCDPPHYMEGEDTEVVKDSVMGDAPATTAEDT